MHGGRSTGPRTPEGMARMIAARTTHGDYGAATQARQRYVRTLVVRSRLLCAARRLWACLPPEMARRLALGPAELSSPMHPSHAACVALHVREVARLAARAEKESQAPWRQAIAFARVARRAARAGARAVGDKTPISRHDPMQLPASGPRQGGEAAAVVRLAAPSPAELRDATPDQVRGRLSSMAPAADAGRAGGDKTHISRHDPRQQPVIPEPVVGLRPGDQTEGVARLAAPSPAELRDATSDQVRGRLSPVASVTGAGRAAGDKTPISRHDPMQQPATGLRQGGKTAAVARLAAASPVKLRGATPGQVRGRLSPVAPATGGARAAGDKTHISRHDPMQQPGTG
jgi:hypothetical protein